MVTLIKDNIKKKKDNITNCGADSRCGSPDVRHGKALSITAAKNAPPNYEETSKLRIILQNNVACNFQKCQYHENQRKTKELFQIEGN